MLRVSIERSAELQRLTSKSLKVSHRLHQLEHGQCCRFVVPLS